MRFVLVDRIESLEPGERIVAHKALSLAEEYLGDHFPKFPVMPGVLMLEAMVQASAWLVRASLDFAPSVVVLKEARNLTYKSFVRPGRVLTIESVCKSLDGQQSEFSARGHVAGREIVKGRLILRHLCLAEQDSSLADVDEAIRARMRTQFELIGSGPPAGAALATGEPATARS